MRRIQNHIRAWREFRALTQEQVAQRVERHVSTISRLENGEIKLTQEMLERLAHAFDLDDPLRLLYPPPTSTVAELHDLVNRIKDNRQGQALKILRTFIDNDEAA